MKLITVLILTALISNVYCQQKQQAIKHIAVLTADSLYGRGYVNNGDKKAASYLRLQLTKYGVKPLCNNYFQQFSFPMNTFPGKMELSFNKNNLMPVSQFVVSPGSKSIKGNHKIVYLPDAADTCDAIYDSIMALDLSKKVVVANWLNRKLYNVNTIKAKAVILPWRNMMWWVSGGQELQSTPVFLVVDSVLKNRPEKVKFNIENKFIDKHNTQNVLGYIKGNAQPDSFIVFMAHYDHLGIMGEGNIFKGANDNASGVAMLLALANYYSKTENTHNYSIAFLFVAGEEAGLIGSTFYVNNPVFPLSNIKTVINLDMVGTGSEGIALVNGEDSPSIVSKINYINDSLGLFKSVQVRGETCNSDHCEFHKAGVPAIFIYTKGDEFKHYHVLSDKPETLPLTKFDELFTLLITYCRQL